MTVLGTFAFADMTVEVQSIRSDQLAYEVFWLRRTNPEPQLTLAVKRPWGMAVANLLDLDPAELDRALAEFLKQRSASA